MDLTLLKAEVMTCLWPARLFGMFLREEVLGERGSLHKQQVQEQATAFVSRHRCAMQFVVEASTLVKTVVTTRQEDVEAPLLVEKEPWQLPKSIFAARAKRGPQQCDAKDYFDTPKVLDSMFEADWSKLMGKVCNHPCPPAAVVHWWRSVCIASVATQSGDD